MKSYEGIKAYSTYLALRHGELLLRFHHKNAIPIRWWSLGKVL